MPDFNIYLQQQANILGTTRKVFVAFPQNPVTAVDARTAIGQAATALVGAVGEAVAVGTYTALPVGADTTISISGFNRSPVFGS